MRYGACLWMVLGIVASGLLGTACATKDRPVAKQLEPSCLAVLCDSIAKAYGGYSSHVQCADGRVLRTFLSRSECLERFPETVRQTLLGDGGSNCDQAYEQALEDCAAADAKTRCAKQTASCAALIAGQLSQ